MDRFGQKNGRILSRSFQISFLEMLFSPVLTFVGLQVTYIKTFSLLVQPQHRHQNDFFKLYFQYLASSSFDLYFKIDANKLLVFT